MPERFFVGLDLGQSVDFTAIAVVERVAAPPVARIVERSREVIPAGQSQSVRVREEVTVMEEATSYHVGHLHRLPLGTSYPAIVEHVAALMKAAPLSGPVMARDGNSWLIADATGVGRPVVDLLNRAELYPVAVTITGGNEVTPQGARAYGVPKRDLVMALLVALQTGRLKVASGLPEAAALVNELLAFRLKVSSTGADTFEAWRESAHDDLVLALGVAVWWAERRSQRRQVVPR